VTPAPRPVRDREVVIAAALVVAGVLIVAWLTGLFPVLDDAVGLAPLVIVGLVVVTVGVLFVALRPRRR
jgi:fatty acid desaturase